MAYIPFPNSQKILYFGIGVEQGSDFLETGRQILSTLRFVDQSPALVAMATQTAAAFIPPAETSRTEYTDINELSPMHPSACGCPPTCRKAFP